jgi:hypothetical protein
MTKFTLALIVCANLLAIPLGFVFGRFVFDLSPPFMLLGFVLGFGLLNAAAVCGLYLARRDRIRSQEDSAKQGQGVPPA